MTDENDFKSLPMPTEPCYIKQHKNTDKVADAHPIDISVLKSIWKNDLSIVTIEYFLSMLQAVATQNIEEIKHEMNGNLLVKEKNNIIYFQVPSTTFYRLAFKGSEMYNTGIKIEQLEFVMEAHTRQFLSDLHNYNGDFKIETCNSNDNKDPRYKAFEKTISSAQTDSNSIRQEEPESANYASEDSRGLVIEKGTHRS